MTIGEWLHHAHDTLVASGCPDPQVDARWIAEDTLGMTRAELHFEADRAMNEESLARLDSLLRQRAQGEPVQWLR